MCVLFAHGRLESAREGWSWEQAEAVQDDGLDGRLVKREDSSAGLPQPNWNVLPMYRPVSARQTVMRSSASSQRGVRPSSTGKLRVKADYISSEGGLRERLEQLEVK